MAALCALCCHSRLALHAWLRPSGTWVLRLVPLVVGRPAGVRLSGGCAVPGHAALGI